MKRDTTIRRKHNINFDHNATTPPTEHVLKTLQRLYRNGYANPSAVYKDGWETSEMVEKARLKVSTALGCDEDEIIFTSGASESNSLVQANCLLDVDDKSHHSIQRMPDLPKGSLKAIPMVVSETGEWLIDVIRANPDKEYFVDLTQAIGKMKINLHDMPNIMYASASGHKFGGILGCGILYINKNCKRKIRPLIYGSQEKGLRGGTLNVPAIVCFGEAIEEATRNINKNQKRIRDITNYIYINCKLPKYLQVLGMPLFLGNLDGETMPVQVRQAEPYTNVINITFKHLTATAAVQIFDKLGFNISAGSACSSGDEKPSEAYLASGYTSDEAMKTIRVSIGGNNTLREAKKFIRTLKRVVMEYDNG